MWLDMYAEERHYISRHSKNEKLIEEIWDKNYELLANRWFNCIFKQSMYWRKAFWIHRYFVDKIQDWYDDCKDYFIPSHVMKDLLDKIKKILRAYKKWWEGWIEVAEKLLPIPDYWDEYTDWKDKYGKPYYIKSLEETKEWLIEALDDVGKIDYYYSSSR